MRHVRQELALGLIRGLGGELGFFQLVRASFQLGRLSFEATLRHQKFGIGFPQRRFGPLELLELLFDRLPGLAGDLCQRGLLRDGLRHLQDFDGVEGLLEHV